MRIKERMHTTTDLDLILEIGTRLSHFYNDNYYYSVCISKCNTLIIVGLIKSEKGRTGSVRISQPRINNLRYFSVAGKGIV